MKKSILRRCLRTAYVHNLHFAVDHPREAMERINRIQHAKHQEGAALSKKHQVEFSGGNLHDHEFVITARMRREAAKKALLEGPLPD